MSASKSCPACQKQWAGTFKFCPEDGALLVVLNAADTVLQTPAAPEPAPAPQRAPAVAPFTGSDTVVVTAVPVHDTDEFAKARAKPEPQRESWRSPVAAAAVVQATTEPERSGNNPKSRKSPRLLNLEPVDSSEITTSRDNAESIRAAVAAPVPEPRRELELRTAPTVMSPSAVEHLATESRGRQAQPIEQVVEAARPSRAPAEVRVEPKAPERAPAEPQRKGKGRAPAEPSRNSAGSEASRAGSNKPAEPTRAAPQRRVDAPTVTAPVAELAPKTSLPRKAEPDIVTLAKPTDAARTMVTAAAPSLSKGGAGAATAVAKRATFSEAAWFMRTEFEIDPETGRVAVGPSDYVLDESIPEDKRRRFSLGRKGEE